VGEKKFGTRLILEVDYPNSMGPNVRYQSEVEMWDANMEDLAGMFKGLCLAHGFSPDNVADYLNTD
jgi:hypothetical protein